MVDSPLQLRVPNDLAGARLDQAAASLFPDYSRARLQHWIGAGLLLVNGREGKTKQKLLGGETLTLTPEAEPQGEWEAEALPLEVVYSDDQLIVINKPAGLVVHPAAGNYQGTLLNGLLYRFPELVNLPRAGIVHRLDKDTTGLMVVARNLQGHQSLVAQLQARTVTREYLAIVEGLVLSAGKVNAPLGRHPHQRQKMAVVREGQGKEAITHFEVIERFEHQSALRLRLGTGRTHQIRVHMTHIGFPLVGDPTYGKPPKSRRSLSPALIEQLQQFSRQALHARKLALIHPATGQEMMWEAALPDDLQQLMAALRDSAASGPR